MHIDYNESNEKNTHNTTNERPYHNFIVDILSYNYLKKKCGGGTEFLKVFVIHKVQNANHCSTDTV